MPSGRIDKDFIREQARLFLAFAEGSAIEQISLKVALLIPLLLLQTPHTVSKRKDHIKCLERRLQLWSLGQIAVLVKEGKTLQACLQQKKTHNSNPERFSERQSKTFANAIQSGYVKVALRIVTEDKSGGVLGLNDKIDGITVADILKEKHPSAQSVSPDALLPIPSPPVETHPIVFEQISGELIRSTVLRVRGYAGPSGMDVFGWCRMCTSVSEATQVHLVWTRLVGATCVLLSKEHQQIFVMLSSFSKTTVHLVCCSDQY